MTIKCKTIAPPCCENAQILAPWKEILGSLDSPLLHPRGHLQTKPVVLKLWFKTSRATNIWELIQNADSQGQSLYPGDGQEPTSFPSSPSDSDVH